MTAITTPAVSLAKRNQTRNRTIAVAAGAVAVVALIWVAVAMRAPAAPKNDAIGLVKTASASEFTTANAEKQRQWMVALEDRSDQIVQAHREGKVNDQEFRTAMNLAWMAKQEGHMTKYYSLPAGRERDAYLDKLAKKHYEAKDAVKANPALDDGFNHDEVWEDAWVAKWPADKRNNYLAYRKAMLEHREAYKAANRPAKAPKK
jgi:hypothetical protein